MSARSLAAAGLGGLAGTAVMTAALAAESALRPASEGAIDYDASDHVVIAASRVLRRSPPRTERGKRRLFNVVHWGYGSAVAFGYDALRQGMGSEPKAGVAFYAGCQAMALTLFPTLGGTPPPWRWKRELLVSSFAVHALYVATVVTVSRMGRAAAAS